jgi:hypothetical protein
VILVHTPFSFLLPPFYKQFQGIIKTLCCPVYFAARFRAAINKMADGKTNRAQTYFNSFIKQKVWPQQSGWGNKRFLLLKKSSNLNKPIATAFCAAVILG